MDRSVKVRVARATYGVECFLWVDENNPEHQRKRAQWTKGVTGQYKIDRHFWSILHKVLSLEHQVSPPNTDNASF